MKKNPQTILDLSSQDALDFLLQSTQYQTFELPEYFDFTRVLQFVKDTVADKPYDECVNSMAGKCDTNLDIMLNKDGRYAVRPLVLCNPYLYYFLARELSRDDNWAALKDCFSHYAVPHIKSCALPVVPNKYESFHKSTAILNWWNSIEQRSIELSLDYRYMFVTDITNCYGSVNPQTIDWALSLRGTQYETDANRVMAGNIMRYLRDMQHGRNIGIPQGSTLFDLTAEVILGYADLLLHSRLQEKGIDGYEILRFRDDYRIFCNDKDKLEQISYILQEVLESLNFRMNCGKTQISDKIVTDAVKSDKLAYIFNTPIFNKKGCDFDGLQKHLLYILMFGRKHPNSGQLRTLLSDFDKRVKRKLRPRKSQTDPEKLVPGVITENIKAMSAIATQIAVENVGAAHYALRVVSRMANSITDPAEHWGIVDKVCKKMMGLHNSAYYQMWLQNMTYRRDTEEGLSPYDVRLCKVVMGEEVDLWDNTWLNADLTKDFPQSSVVNADVLDRQTPVITFRETRAYQDALSEDGEFTGEYDNEWVVLSL